MFKDGDGVVKAWRMSLALAAGNGELCRPVKNHSATRALMLRPRQLSVAVIANIPAIISRLLHKMQVGGSKESCIILSQLFTLNRLLKLTG